MSSLTGKGELGQYIHIQYPCDASGILLSRTVHWGRELAQGNLGINPQPLLTIR